MVQGAEEEIRVAVIHGPGSRLKPIWFDWKRHKHEIREITYQWREKVGSQVILRYAVSDGSTLYHLSYSPATQVWRLAGSHVDGHE